MALQAEMRMLEMLHHPRVVQYYGCQRYDDGSFVIFMEYMPGVSELLVLAVLFCVFSLW